MAQEPPAFQGGRALLEEEVAEVMQYTPPRRGPARIAKRVADVPVPPGMEEIVAVVQEKRVQQRTVDVPMPQIMEEPVEVVSSAPLGRVQQRTVDAPMPHVVEERVEDGSGRV